MAPPPRIPASTNWWRTTGCAVAPRPEGQPDSRQPQPLCVQPRAATGGRGAHNALAWCRQLHLPFETRCSIAIDAPTEVVVVGLRLGHRGRREALVCRKRHPQLVVAPGLATLHHCLSGAPGPHHHLVCRHTRLGHRGVAVWLPRRQCRLPTPPMAVGEACALPQPSGPGPVPAPAGSLQHPAPPCPRPRRRRADALRAPSRTWWPRGDRPAWQPASPAQHTARRSTSASGSLPHLPPTPPPAPPSTPPPPGPPGQAPPAATPPAAPARGGRRWTRKPALARLARHRRQ